MRRALGFAIVILAAGACRPNATEETTMKKNAAADRVVHTDAEWRARLTPEQYRVCREQGTEPAGSGAYVDHFATGTYVCVACGAPLFASTTKYESSCGWPAFYDAIPGATSADGRGSAVEVHCARCDSHLGHIFDDGPPPTGKRY